MLCQISRLMKENRQNAVLIFRVHIPFQRPLEGDLSIFFEITGLIKIQRQYTCMDFIPCQHKEWKKAPSCLSYESNLTKDYFKTIAVLEFEHFKTKRENAF